jgi:HD-GYP domain-containing protein (c-di-GMP phosphodiesterase class II)
MKYNLNIREVTYSLSGALDLVGIDDTLHGKRVAFMAAELAKELDYDNNIIDDLIFIGMLHDCGVSSTDVHTHLVTELDWNNSQVHSIRGFELLKATNIYEKYAVYVKYHHTHWKDLPETLTLLEKELSNIIYLVDRVDALNAQMKNEGIKAVPKILEVLKKYSNDMFSDKLVKAFISLSLKNSFWFYLESEALEGYFLDWIDKVEDESFDFYDLKNISLMFAAVVDAKSEFTSEHSVGVSSLARYLAELFNLNEESCEIIELAGLLHDLGKLRVDDTILNKTSALSPEERIKMNRHGFDSYVILRRIKGFKKIAYLASLHHETLDAKGYPYNLKESEIPFEARILTVADIFQAFIQNRPYRKGISMEDSFNLLDEMSKEGKVDLQIIEMLKNNLEECYKKATVKYKLF